MEQLQGKVAFITGGAQGIGLGIARALAAAGVKLALADIDDAALDAAAKDLGSGTSVETFTLDVRDRDAFAAAADRTESTLGSVDLLFNNAGVATAVPPAKMTYEMWDWVLGINLNGVVNGMQTFVPRMIERGAGGHIVNTSSGAGLAAAGSGFLYTTSKFAVVGMSESLRIELAPNNIGVSVLCPGPVATDILTNTRGREPQSGDDRIEAKKDQAAEAGAVWLHAGKTPDEVGQMVLSAVKSDAPYIHTDTMIAGLIEARTKTILDAMPS